MSLVRAAVVEKLRVHPRVAQQGLGEAREARERLFSSLPRIVPFPGRALHGVAALLDWDHRLPSKKLTLRLIAFYTAASLATFEAKLAERMESIRERDLFPEFDVPDWEELPGDEAYDAELTSELSVEATRLVSPWRREVPRKLGDRAVDIVRGSDAFAEVKRTTGRRPPNLPDLEASGWIPPCESGHVRWSLDVWWLTDFDGKIGKGWSFLVDSDSDGEPVVAARPFQVRAG